MDYDYVHEYFMIIYDQLENIMHSINKTNKKNINNVLHLIIQYMKKIKYHIDKIEETYDYDELVRYSRSGEYHQIKIRIKELIKKQSNDQNYRSLIIDRYVFSLITM